MLTEIDNKPVIYYWYEYRGRSGIHSRYGYGYNTSTNTDEKIGKYLRSPHSLIKNVYLIGVKRKIFHLKDFSNRTFPYRRKTKRYFKRGEMKKSIKNQIKNS